METAIAIAEIVACAAALFALGYLHGVKNGFVEAWTEDSLVAILTGEEAKELVDHLLMTWRRSHS